MTRILQFVVGLSTALLLGCSAQQSIQQSKDLSTSGIAYSEAVDKLLDVTIDRVIDFDTQELRKARRGSNPGEIIRKRNAAVGSVLIELERFRAQTKLLKTYFVDLQALANSPIKADAGGAVKSLSDSISKLNKTLGGNEGTESLTADQKAQIGALGGLVASAIHGKIIRRALARDARIIGTYLALQENQLGNITAILKDRFLAENDLFLNQKVIAPYVDRSQTLGQSWANDRKQWFKTQFISQQLATARDAANQLRGIWADILEGKTDTNSMSVMLSGVNEFLTTVQALKAAGEEN